MKTCPRCGGEVRPSVIKCVHCGASLREVGEAASVAGAAPVSMTAGAAASRAAPASSAGATATVTSQAPAATPTPSGPSADVWVTPTVRSDQQVRPPVDGSSTQEAAHGRTKRVREVDPVLLVAGVLAIGAAVLAFLSLSMPWVQARMVTTDGKLREHVVANLAFSASDSLAGQIGIGLAIVFALLGLVWFWYGLARGAPIPWVAHVVVVVAAVIAGVALIGLTHVGSLFWRDAFAMHARAAGMTKDAMQELLARHPAPVIEVERLTGITRFGVAVGLALVAGTVAWWGQRNR